MRVETDDPNTIPLLDSSKGNGANKTLYKLQQVYDVGAIKVKNVSNGTVGKSVTFLVETSQAGKYFIRWMSFSNASIYSILFQNSSRSR